MVRLLRTLSQHQDNTAGRDCKAVAPPLWIPGQTDKAVSPAYSCFKCLSLTLSIVLWLLIPPDANAQALIEEQQRLEFGTLAVSANSTISSYSFSRTGDNVDIEGQFVLIARGTPGRYSFSGFPANTTLSVSLDSTSLSAEGIGISEPLTVDNYDFLELTTNSQGEAELTLGARLVTTGNGNTYEDAFYSGSAILRVDYWQPDIKAYVFNTEVISMTTQLSSTLTVDEMQKLHFGTLFARSSNTSQAELVLSPSGSYTISEPNDSRLVALARPEEGIFQVSGAAPNYSLTVAPQVADVLLEHTENPASSPHFIMSNLLVSTEGTGNTDENGELLIRLGGTLKTELTATPQTYPSGEYEGTYELTVSY